VLIIAPVADAEPETHTCGICGFVMHEAAECPRCRPVIKVQAQAMLDTGERRSVLDQVRDLLA
jgi:hypothetical protein